MTANIGVVEATRPDPTFSPARRGDLAIVVKDSTHFVIGQGTVESTDAYVCVVTNITRQGHVVAVRMPGDHEGDRPSRLEHMGRTSVFVCSQARVDVAAAVAAAEAHTWPGHSYPMPFESLEEARACVRPFLKS